MSFVCGCKWHILTHRERQKERKKNRCFANESRWLRELWQFNCLAQMYVSNAQNVAINFLACISMIYSFEHIRPHTANSKTHMGWMHVLFRTLSCWDFLFYQVHYLQFINLRWKVHISRWILNFLLKYSMARARVRVHAVQFSAHR